MAENTVSNEILKSAVPAKPFQLTFRYFRFGVEMEMLYVFPMDSMKTFSNLPQIAQAPEHDKTFLYVAAVLRREWPVPPHHLPSCLGAIRVDDWSNEDYSAWAVTQDESVGADVRELARHFRIHQEEFLKQFGWANVELVSPVLSTVDDSWTEHFRQIQMQLSPQTGIGAAYTNSTCGLHVHLSLEDQPNGLPLQMLKNLVIMWAIWEETLEAMHPYKRRAANNHYAQSLWPHKRAVEDPVLTPHALFMPRKTFASLVYAAADADDIKKLLQPSAYGAKYSKINISAPNFRGKPKPVTIEFREHRGTTNAMEICYWVVFLTHFAAYVSNETERGWVYVDEMQLLDTNLETHFPDFFAGLTHLFALIGLPSYIQEWFLNKVNEYEETADVESNPSLDGSDSEAPDNDDEEIPRSYRACPPIE
jgi:hypothetical protein